jgi:large exoprotein involved in heme utilization and adhesion
VLASSKGSGHGGDVVIAAEQATFTDGARITSDSTSTMPGAGQAGTVNVDATGSLALNAASVTTEAAEGMGGAITLSAQSLLLANGASVSTRSTGSGNSGDIKIVANDLFRSHDSKVTTEATQAFGGNIDIQTQRMIQLTDSQILTSVQSGAGNGGNITIDPQFLILDNTQILAQAVAGNGGNISIVAGTMMVSPGSLINASSQTGISGQVSIQAPVTNLAAALSRLSQTPLNAAELLTARCAARLREGQTSSLTLAGRDGVPAEPGGWRPTAFLLAALRPTGASSASARATESSASPVAHQLAGSELHTLGKAGIRTTGCDS